MATSNGTITVNYFDGVNPGSTTRAVQGTSVAAANITISNSPTYDFGTIANGASLDFTFTVTNTGTFGASSMTGGGLIAPFSFKGGSFPGTGGTCNTGSLAGSNATCTVVVTFAPGTTGSHSAPLQINYNNGASNQQSSITVQGTSAGPAVLTISDGPTYDFGTVATTTTKDKSFTINNSGGVTATAMSGSGLSLPMRFKGGTYPGLGGSCSSTLNAGQSCTVVVNYAPTSAVTTNQTLSIAYTDGVSAQSATRPVTGTGAAPALLTMSPSSSYDYGTYPVSATAEQTFTISNSGGMAATSVLMNGLAAPFDFKGGSYPGTGGNCTSSIAISGSCTIVVTFTPGAIGALSDAIDVSYNDGAVTQSFSTTVQGTGTTAALLTISDAGFTYGTVANGSTTDKTFTVTNSGGVASTAMTGASFSPPYSFKGGTYPGTGGNCSSTLAAGANCSIVVTYAPSTIATHNATIQINYNDGLISTNAQRAITGTAVAPASLTISDGPTYDYGTLFTGFDADKTFTVTNSGSFTATSMAGVGLAAPFTYLGGSYPGTGGTCSASLALTSCTIVVRYAPVSVGTDTQTAQINYNNGAANVNAQRAVVGTAIPPVTPSAPGTPTITISSFGQLDLAWTGSATARRLFSTVCTVQQQAEAFYPLFKVVSRLR